MSNLATREPETSSEARMVHISKSSFYRPELDVLRFAAFLMVFLFHVLPDKESRYPSVHSVLLKKIYASIACSMGFGVCLFFILSAFLITTLLLRERRTTSTINLHSFYKRRILRIWPLYFLILVLALLSCSLSIGFPGYGVIAAYLLMAGNLLSKFHLSGDIRPLKIFHLWSISVEEQFYLVFPVIAKKIKLSFLFVIPGLLIILSSLALLHLTREHATKEEIWQNSFVQFSMFAAGISLALFFNGRRLPRIFYLTRIFLMLLGASICIAAQFFFRIGGEGLYVTTSHALLGYFLVAMGCSMLLFAVLGSSTKMPTSLVYLGKISYGLYMFHVWSISLASFLISSIFHISMAEGTAGFRIAICKDTFAFFLTVVFSTISYRFIEKPFLNFKKKYEVVSTRAA